MLMMAGGFSEALERRRALSEAVGSVLRRVEELASTMRARPAQAAGRRDAGVGAWAGVGQSVTFRAEVMPGRDRAQRTFRVAETLANRRVLLVGMAGEHSRWEFESKD